MHRWIVLTAGVVLQTVLGGVYAWSAFVPSLNSEYNITKGQCGLIFGVTIAVFTLSMIPAGRILQKIGPRITALIGSLLFIAGYLLASISNGHYLIILTGIGILTGAGIGAGYVCPLTVGMKWFPDNKGLVTGVAVAGFGGGAIILSYFVRYMLVHLEWNVLQVFKLVGIGFGTIAVVAALFLKEPQKPDGYRRVNLTLDNIKSYILSKPFLMLFSGMFAGTFAGLLTVGNLKPILLGSGLDDSIATLGISIFAVGNATGRILWGQIHDKLGSRKTIIISLAFLAVSILPLALRLAETYTLLIVIIAGMGFGACFVVYASAMVKYYGTELFPNLYPICFLGYGLAGITGPATGGWIADITSSFATGIILSALIILAALISIICWLPSETQYKEICT